MKKILITFIFCLMIPLLFSCALPIPEAPETNTVEYEFYLDGAHYKTVKVEKGKSFKTPSVEIPAGYRFDGWYADSEYTTEYNGEEKAYARLLVNDYTVTVYGEDEGIIETIPYTVLSDDIHLDERDAKDGYTFRGYRDGKTGVVYTSVTIPGGSSGNRAFYAVFAATEYSIQYDYDGGVGENPTVYTVKTPTFTLTPPTRSGYRFVGWRVGEETLTELTVSLGSTENLSVLALWEPLSSDFLMESAPSGIPLSVRFGDEVCVTGTEITLTAPAVHNGYYFLGWYLGDTLLSRSSELTIQKPAGETSVIAKYEQPKVLLYDKAAGANLVIPYDSTKTPTELHGAGIRYLLECEFSLGKVMVDKKALSSLDEGDYTLYILSEDEAMYVILRVTDTTETQLSLNYDTAHFPAPKIELDCSCGGEHTYSLDGGNQAECFDGVAIPAYDKSKAHTLTVTCLSSGRKTSVSLAGYLAAAEKYYNSSFTYLGNTYDYVIMSEEELCILIEYLALVRGVMDGKVQSDTYEFWIDGALYEEYGDKNAFDTLMTSVVRGLSLPMSPSFSTYVGSVNPNYKGIAIKYESGFNSAMSSQEKTSYEDAQGYFSETGREDGYKDFPIDKYEKTVEIRTLYELERLPYGYKPVFHTNASDAKAVYDAAREILTQIIDDGMTDYEKVLAIYAWLGLKVTYDDVTYESEDSKYRAFTSYGAIVDRLAVCDGYASAFNIFLAIEGIESIEVTGLAVSGGVTMGHAWNKFSIDGAWYGADPTWAGKNGRVTMEYLFMDEEALLYTGHLENAGYTDRATGIACQGPYSYFEAVFTEGVTYDLYIEGERELISALRYMIENGLSVLEVRCFSQSLSEWLQAAVNELRLDSLSYANLGDGYYYFILEG